MVRNGARRPHFLSDASRAIAPALGNLDEVRFQDALIRNVDPDGLRRIPAGCRVYLRGWVCTPPGQAASEVFVLVGGDASYPVVYGDRRRDIATHYENFDLEHVGFRGVFPLAGLPLGHYDFRLAAIAVETGDYHVLDTGERFEIVESRHLFPGKSVAPKGRVELKIDAIETYSGKVPARGSLDVRRGETVLVRGWAIDREQVSAAGGVFALIDGKEYVGGVHGLPRNDVALALDLLEARKCGFTIRIPTDGFARGAHKLDIISLAADGISYAIETGVKLSVTA